MPKKRHRRPDLHRYSSIAPRPPFDDGEPRNRGRVIIIVVIVILVAVMLAAASLLRSRI